MACSDNGDTFAAALVSETPANRWRLSAHHCESLGHAREATMQLRTHNLSADQVDVRGEALDVDAWLNRGRAIWQRVQVPKGPVSWNGDRSIAFGALTLGWQ